MNLDKSKKLLAKKAKRGFQGYPLITIAYYGPNDKHATKVVVGFIAEEHAPALLEKFMTEADARMDATVHSAIIKIIERSGAKSVVLGAGIMGCPHEEGIDYPESEECPECAFWQGKDRFTGKPV
ncbi:MAG: hypothetical protein V7629_10200 [Motiliproteus sp.]